MKTLINDLLAYSRVGTRGKEFAKVDLNIILDQVLTTLGPSIQQENALITFDPLPKLVVDEGQIQNLFQNLVVNAIKFHGPESPKIHIPPKKKKRSGYFLSGIMALESMSSTLIGFLLYFSAYTTARNMKAPE